MDSRPCGSERLESRLPTYQQDVMCNGTKVPVTVTKEGRHVESWIEGQSKHSAFGMDVEWKPNRYKGQDNKVSLLQLSSPTDCMLVQMSHLDYVPNSLREFLKDPSKTMAGVGIAEDGRKLARDHGLECRGLVELGKHDVPGMEPGSRKSLKSLAKHVLDLDMNKSREVKLSNWSQRHLDSKQVEYACLDAWAAGSIHSTFSGATGFNTPPPAGGKPSSSGGSKPSSGSGAKSSSGGGAKTSSAPGSKASSSGRARPSSGGGSGPKTSNGGGSSKSSSSGGGGGSRPSNGGGGRRNK